MSLSFKGLSTICKLIFLYCLSVQQTLLGAACTPSCHPENDHHDVHLHPAEPDRDHPKLIPLQEVQGQFGKFKSSTSKHLYWWCSHCASKTSIWQNTALPTQEEWKPQFWLAYFTFPSMAAALYLSKLVKLFRSGCLNQLLNGSIKWHLLNDNNLDS